MNFVFIHINLMGQFGTKIHTIEKSLYIKNQNMVYGEEVDCVKIGVYIEIVRECIWDNDN